MEQRDAIFRDLLQTLSERGLTRELTAQLVRIGKSPCAEENAIVLDAVMDYYAQDRNSLVPVTVDPS